MAYGDSTATSLAAVRTAIDNCLVSQASTIQGKSNRRAELAQLMELELMLMAKLNSENGTYGPRPVQINNPSGQNNFGVNGTTLY